VVAFWGDKQLHGEELPGGAFFELAGTHHAL